MTTFSRWLKFNLVGLVGMGVQLTLVASFNHLLHNRHALIATAAAVELTLFHNFLWHLHYTWRDRRDTTPRLHQVLRFHLSNGLVSLIGNLALMGLLTNHTHLPLLVAGLIAILCCSFVNFALAHSWTFPAPEASRSATPRRSRNTALASSCFVICIPSLMTGGSAHGQNSTPGPASQQGKTMHAAPPKDFGLDCAYESVFVGPAVARYGTTLQPTVTAGVSVGEYFAKPLGKGISASPLFELGIVGPLPGGYQLDGLFSFNFMFANKVPHRELFPFATGGYSRLFATGNALNFGIGFDFGSQQSDHVTRVELRDYYLFTGPQQHVIELRIAFGQFVPD